MCIHVYMYIYMYIYNTFIYMHIYNDYQDDTWRHTSRQLPESLEQGVTL